MGSIGIDTLCREYPDMSVEQAATVYARENGFIVVMKYKSSENATEYTDIATCLIDDEITAYMESPYCFNPIVIYDARRGIEDEPPRKKTILWKEWIRVVKSEDIVSLHQLERKFGLTIMWNDQCGLGFIHHGWGLRLLLGWWHICIWKQDCP